MQPLLRRLTAEQRTLRQQQAWRERLPVPGSSRLRWRQHGRPVVSFCSNDYLGLAEHPALVEVLKQAVDSDGIGAGGSVFVGGYHEAHALLEARLAKFLGRERALLFSSGYLANLGVARSLFRKGDRVFEDRLNHASLIDASRGTPADISRYAHNDIEQLQRRLQSESASPRFIVSDAIFSMDGDAARLPSLSALAAQHDAVLWLDDAHGFGVTGPGGRGSIAQAQLDASSVPILVGTLGKAAGSSGAFVAGDRLVIESIAQHARTMTFTTAMPPALARVSTAALDLIETGDHLRTRAWHIATTIKTALNEMDYAVSSDSLILPVVLGSNEAALQKSQALADAGFMVKAIRPPTVPTDTARLRITVSAGHTDAEVECFVTALQRVLRP